MPWSDPERRSLSELSPARRNSWCFTDLKHVLTQRPDEGMKKVPVSIRQEWHAELGWEGYSCVTKAAQSPSPLLSLHISYHEEVLGEPLVPPAVWTAALKSRDGWGAALSPDWGWGPVTEQEVPGRQGQTVGLFICFVFFTLFSFGDPEPSSQIVARRLILRLSLAYFQSAFLKLNLPFSFKLLPFFNSMYLFFLSYSVPGWVAGRLTPSILPPLLLVLFLPLLFCLICSFCLSTLPILLSYLAIGISALY